ncbi:hypothetical protein MRX96_027118 [Rhipicephalus microplus]
MAPIKRLVTITKRMKTNDGRCLAGCSTVSTMIWSKAGNSWCRRLAAPLASSSCHGCGVAAPTRSPRKGTEAYCIILDDRRPRRRSPDGRQHDDQEDGGAHGAPSPAGRLTSPTSLRLRRPPADARSRKTAGAAAGAVSARHDDVCATLCFFGALQRKV